MNRCDVILVNPAFLDIHDYPFPPYHYMFLAPKLANAGYKVKVFDQQIEDVNTLEKIVKESNPIWIGFHCTIGPLISSALKISKILKEVSPNTSVVYGGPFPTLCPEITLENECVDVVVIGEGEETVVELTRALEKKGNLDEVKGIAYKNKEKKVILTKPREIINDWDKDVEFGLEYIDLEKYIRNLDGEKNLPIITSRGCPHRCGFCWNIKANRRRWRSWSAEHTIYWLKKLVEQGVTSFTVMDDNFNVNSDRLKKIATFFKENNITWSMDGGYRVYKSQLNEEFFGFLKESNCRHITVGAESASQKILDYVQKDIKVEDLITLASLTAKYDMGIKYNWVIGFPTETEDDRNKTLDLIDKISEINPKSSHFINLFIPYPGAPLFDEAVKFGWKSHETLEDWAKHPAEKEYPYWKDIWKMRSISYSCYFVFAANSPSRDIKITKFYYNIPIQLFKILARLRWRFRMFEYPLEYKILNRVLMRLEKN